MSISRRYFLVATLFLLLGMAIGLYMGAAGDFRLTTTHAHANLVGFVLLMIFGLVYRAVPAMGASPLARVHLWVHTLGALWMLGFLAMLALGRIGEGTMALSALGELALLAGAVLFLVNLLRNGCD